MYFFASFKSKAQTFWYNMCLKTSAWRRDSDSTSIMIYSHLNEFKQKWCTLSQFPFLELKSSRCNKIFHSLWQKQTMTNFTNHRKMRLLRESKSKQNWRSISSLFLTETNSTSFRAIFRPLFALPAVSAKLNGANLTKVQFCGNLLQELFPFFSSRISHYSVHIQWQLTRFKGKKWYHTFMPLSSSSFTEKTKKSRCVEKYTQHIIFFIQSQILSFDKFRQFVNV